MLPDSFHEQFTEDEMGDDEHDADEGDALHAGSVAKEENVRADLGMTLFN